MTERDFEEIICRYPCLIEEGAVFDNRQVTIKTKRLDVQLRDKTGKLMLLELKVGAIQRADMAQVLEYEGYYSERGMPDVRVFLVGTNVPTHVQHACTKHGVEWRELTHEKLLTFLQARDDPWAIALVRSHDLERVAATATGRVGHPRSNAAVPMPPTRQKALLKEGTETWNLRFFNQLLALSNAHLDLFRRKPAECQPTVTFLGVNAGVKNTDWNYGKSFVKLVFFDKDKARNDLRFDHVRKHRFEIEVAFGESLEWDFSPGRSQQHIISQCKAGSPYARNESEWSRIQADLVDRMKRLVEAIRLYLPQS